ncbi:MAG: acyltransferase family protein [Acidimicrobiales bacterium]
MGRVTPPSSVESSPQRRLQYQPALDGLRAVALLGVVAYHAGIDELHGGFLGVSTFFTLSGFLITSLLIREQAASGRVSLIRFWNRRLRRLMPAALATIAATVVLAALIGDDSQLARLRGDGLASLFHFSNWRFISAGDSYGALFQSPSFFRHFWSLAVEEQYYLAVPPLIAAALALAGRRATRAGLPVARSRGLAVFLLAFAAAGLAWPAILSVRGAGTDRLYFGTDTRLGELTVGALLALWFVRRDQQIVTGRRGIAVATALTVAAVIITGFMWHTAHPGDEYLYRGGLALHALLTVPVIVAAVAPGGPVRALLSFEPLRRLGVVSYGAYLTHWPILLWLQQETDLDPLGRFAAGSVLTLVASLTLHRLVEQPFRSGERAARVRVWVAVPASLTVAALVIGVTSWRQPDSAPIDFAAAQDALAALDDPVGSSSDTTPSGDIAPDTTSGPLDPDAPMRLAAFGDSTALMTGLGILQWAETHPSEVEIVRGNAKLGCGLLSGGTRMVEGREVEVPDECDGWLADWIDVLGDRRVDVAVVQLGAWEVTDHRLEGSDEFRSIDDADHRARQEAALDEMILALLEHADTVALLAHPDVGEARLSTIPAGVSYPEYDPRRAQAWRDLEYAAADGPDAVDADHTFVIDLASWIDQRPDDVRLRPDGVHFSQETGAEVAQWLVPEIRRGLDAVLDAAPEPVDPVDPVDPEPLRVLLTGDSLMVDSADAIAAALATADRPIVVQFEGQPARPRTVEQTDDWRTRVEAFGPDLVVEYMGYWEIAAGGLADPPYGTPGFAEGYRTQTLDPWFDHLASIGSAEIVLAAAPVGNPVVSTTIADVVAILEEEVGDRSGVWFVPTASALAPDGYTDRLVDPRTGELERVRRVDGLHLCPDGAERVTDLVLDVLRREYGLVFDDSWRPGDWRLAPPIDLATECPPLS